ncbi:hypothetical protein HZH68_016454 [Vespula germanica]|uniref:Uncharacterized protein n=1 Tax=Vespula germanica TaxID=30212 RepID=A0A834J2H9_VESGE|nr:hypothetical protein HZH68_016454 [Vespula germanica]
MSVVQDSKLPRRSKRFVFIRKIMLGVARTLREVLKPSGALKRAKKHLWNTKKIGFNETELRRAYGGDDGEEESPGFMVSSIEEHLRVDATMVLSSGCSRGRNVRSNACDAVRYRSIVLWYSTIGLGNRVFERKDVFVNLPKLKTLYLNNNNVSTIHDKAFKHLMNLEELQMTNNQITVITRESFHGLRNLKRLDLRSNLISMIGDRSFVEMPELTELELDQNSIEYISEKAFDGMRNLKKLRLSENRLVTLEPDFLSGAPGIYFLDLRDNILKTVSFNNIKPIVTNLYNSTSYFYLDVIQL